MLDESVPTLLLPPPHTLTVLSCALLSAIAFLSLTRLIFSQWQVFPELQKQREDDESGRVTLALRQLRLYAAHIELFLLSAGIHLQDLTGLLENTPLEDQFSAIDLQAVISAVVPDEHAEDDVLSCSDTDLFLRNTTVFAKRVHWNGIRPTR